MKGLFIISVILSMLYVSINAGVINYGDEHNLGSEDQEIDIKFDGHGDFGTSGYDHSDDHAPVKYSFNYAVNDPHTGDIKQHIEERDGHVVKGSYSLKEADGSTRIVEYHADKHNGFNAKVHTIPKDHDDNNNNNNNEHYGF